MMLAWARALNTIPKYSSPEIKIKKQNKKKT